MNMFVQVLFVICLTGAVLTGCRFTEKKQSASGKLLLISFDGFRYDYLQRTDTPNFDSFIREGIKAEGLIPVFPTKTFPNHYSIATGLYPENTGLVANTMYDPEFEEWYRIYDREAVEAPRWYSGEPIWNTVEKQGLKAGTMFWVGSEAPIQNMRPTYWKPFDDDMPYKARIDTVVKWLGYGEEKDVDLATLYFELVDDAGHDYGLESDSLDFAIQQADSLLGYLKEKLVMENLWDSLNIIIVSDHGMVDLSSDKIIRLDSLIDMEEIDRIVWAPVTMIQPVKGKTDQVYQKLKKAENNYRVYKKEELPERYHLKNHRRVPDIIMIADLGYTILNKDYLSRFLEGLPSATHGYDNHTREMLTFFAARGPAFAEGDTIPTFQSVHLYELMNHLVGTDPAPNDGSLDSVRVMLK